MSAQMMRKTLETDLNHFVVGEAHDPAGALELITKADPEVVLTELRVSGSDMLQLIDQAKKRGKNPAFVVVSSQCDEVTAHRVEKARLHGFIDRRAEMCEAIRHALNEISHGRRYFSPSWVRMRNARVSNPFSFDKLLTKRQYEILGMIAKLVPDEVIMRTLKISQCTLRGHRRAIARKFDVRLPDLPRFAREKGFGA